MKLKEKYNFIIIGDFNASIGEDTKGEWTGKFELKKRNVSKERHIYERLQGT